LTQTDLTFPTLKPTQKVLKNFPPHIGTFAVCPTAQADPQQTPKEPILPTRNKIVENF